MNQVGPNGPAEVAALRTRVQELERELAGLRRAQAAGGTDHARGGEGHSCVVDPASLVGESPDLVFVVERDGCVSYVNSAAAEAFGRSCEALEGRPLMELFPAEVAQERWEQISNVLASGKGATHLSRLPLGSRSLWLDTSLTPLLDDAGVPRRVMGVSRDVTARIEVHSELESATQALKEERALTDTVLDSIPAIFYVLDFEGTFQRWNRRFEEVTGLSAEEVAKTNALELFEGDDRERIAEGIRATAERGSVEVEARFQVRTGPPPYYLFSGRRVEIQGTPLLVGLGLDFEDRKRQEVELLERVKELRCLRDVSVAIQAAVSEGELFARVVDALPPGFQAPELTHARLTVDDLTFHSSPFAESPTGMAVPVFEGEEEVGVLEVFLAHAEGVEVSLLQEEEELLKTVAQMLGEALAYRRSKARYMDLYQNAPDMYASVDPRTGLVLQCNDTLLETTGFSQDEVVGHPVLDRYHPDSVADAKRAFQAFVSTGEVSNVDLRLRSKDGSPLDVSLRVTAVRDADGRIINSRSSWRDITRERALERELRASETRLARFMERLPVPICNVTNEGDMAYANPRFTAVTGYDLGDVPTLDDWWQKAYPDPEYRAEVVQRWTAKVEEAANAGTDIAVDEYDVTCKDGTVLTLQISGVVLKDSILATFADFTDLRRAEAELRRVAERYRALYGSVPVSLWDEDWTEVIGLVRGLGIRDPEELRAYFDAHPEFVDRCLGAVRILEVNRETLGMFAASSTEDLVGSLATVFNTPDTLPGFVDELVALGSGQKRFRTEMRLNTVNGDVITTDLTMTFPDEDAPSNRVLVSLLDISRRVAAETELKRHLADLERAIGERTAELQASNQELEAFAYSVSHDLRAPLRAVSGFSRALMEDYHDVLDEAGQEFLRRCVDGASNMAGLIDDILALSRVSRSEMRAVTLSLTDMGREMAGEVASSRQRDPACVEVEEGMEVRGDRTLVKLLLQNLLDNAFKFTSRVDVPTILVGKTEVDGHAAYYVKDNGAGFDMAHAEGLFQPFQRLHKQTEFEGTGIGLSIVQRVVHRHGGTVWGEGAPGRGATIYLTLPPPRDGEFHET